MRDGHRLPRFVEVEFRAFQRCGFLAGGCARFYCTGCTTEQLVAFEMRTICILSAVALTPGTRLGVYEVTARIGEGGMGQVFRATDTKLKRQVAIKVLPSSVATDADRLARFRREAEVLASLNHPNVAAIYGLEEHPPAGVGQAGVTALVMELIEGDDLSQRIARGAIPLDEALPIARQIAEGLEAAHERGIVHRDLKPANIKVRPDGTVKVLDFGLAKSLDPAGASSSEATHSPTVTSPAMTQAGVILGTAAYMSPEQARGKGVDRRADVWAFGTVLFEMLTGRRAFDGDDVTETLANVINKEPAWDALPPSTPTHVRQTLRLCLKKSPRERVPDVGAVRLALDGAFESVVSQSTPPTAASSRGRLPWIASLAVAVALVATMAPPALRHLREAPPAVPPEMRVEITTPASDAPLQFALSPDGRSLVFVASGDGPSRLWLRPLDRAEAQPLPGTEGATYPFWSPDSRSIGFFAGNALRRLEVGGGAPQLLTAVRNSTAQGSWSADGTILFAHSGGAPVRRIPATGGEVVEVTRLDPPNHTGHRAPQFLPDGRHFLFYVLGTPETSGLYLGSLDGGTPARLTAADSAGGFLPPDHVVFVRQGTLVARRLDLSKGALTGDPVTLADRVGAEGIARGGFSVSAAGSVAYRAGGGRTPRLLTWVDRTGKVVGEAGEPDPNASAGLDLSRDGRRVAMWRGVQGNADIWLMDLVRGGMTRLTFDGALDLGPVWSPDGTRIAFNSNRTGVYDLYVKPSNRSAAETRLVDSPYDKGVGDWSADGRWLVYSEESPTTGNDLWALDMHSQDPTPEVFANTPAQERHARLSPDGHWMVYSTNESSRFEVVVQPFPGAGGKWSVSTNGGLAPRWRADGKELYFVAPDATMMAVPVTASGTSFEAGTPMPLFATGLEDGAVSGASEYAVARDGRFLINRPVAQTTVAPITLILNWRPPSR
ncbi:MAG: protein kinase domain-containing protein [Dehalococcoidia bacterium]